MKKAFVLSCLFLVSMASFCQQNSVNARYEKYLKKSRQKQTAGFIFLGAGAAFAGGGIYMIVDGKRRHNDYINNSNGTYDYLSNGEGEMVLGVFTTIIGTGAMCGSIPFFVGAHRAKEKALSISLKSERTSVLYKASISSQYYPAIALHIPLGR